MTTTVGRCGDDGWHVYSIRGNYQLNDWRSAFAALPCGGRNAGQLETKGGDVNAAVATYAVPRTFAELPYTHSWLKICQHAERLDRAEISNFDTNVEGTWLRFARDGYLFSVGEYRSRVQLSVDDADCPGELLVEITEHFAALLSPHLRRC